MAGKDFRAAFSNMNQAVRPGNEQPVVKKQKMSLAEKRATMHGVQTYLSDEDSELRLRQKRVVKRYYVML
jgi:conserved domain protein